MLPNILSTYSEEQIRSMIALVPYWYHRIEVAPGIVTPGVDNTAHNLRTMNLPADLTGKRVLDIGACDGFYSFECERRGAAQVVAIEANTGPTGFKVLHELLGSHVELHTMNIYDLTPEAFGQFDLVLCLGVLYHLRHPLLGLERVHSVCKGQLILETQVCDHHFIDASGTPQDLVRFAPAVLPAPIVQFYAGAELNQDSTSWWSPNIAALQAMLRSVGFDPYQTIPNGARAYVHCLRREQPVLEEWADTALLGASQASQPMPHAAENGAALSGAALAQSQPSARSDGGVAQLLAQALAAQSQQALQLQQLLALRDAQIADLAARASWLEEQSRDARQALAAVENGRVMRILRWLSWRK
jgi:tRNA (mo5U34)-methyltransferase